MKTSNFKTYKGGMGISICLYPPLDWTGAQFLSLAPSRSIFFAKKAGEIDEKEYEKRYKKEILSKLNPKDIYEQLQKNVLLCWEPQNQFCHRHIISKWIKSELNIEIPEWQPGDDNPKDFQKPLF